MSDGPGKHGSDMMLVSAEEWGDLTDRLARAEGDARGAAFEAIAKLFGGYDYPGQIVREVETLRAELAVARGEVRTTRVANENLRKYAKAERKLAELRGDAHLLNEDAKHWREQAEEALAEAKVLNEDAAYWREKTMEARREAEKWRNRAYRILDPYPPGEPLLPWERGGDESC